MSAERAIEVTVNGQPRRISDGSTVESLLHQLGLRRDLVAVEVNRRLVRRAHHADAVLTAGDQVEVVEFVGGG